MNVQQFPPISIIVLNWNGAADTLACLDSLAALTYPNFNVVVVDNGSSDDSLARLRPYGAPYPLTLLETGRNLGYAGGNNVGMRYALEHGADFVLVLNNDTVVAPDMLEHLQDAALRYPNAAAFSAKIYFFDEPNRIWYAGVNWNDKLSRFIHIGEGEFDDNQRFSKTSEVDYACGCVFFVSAERLHEIGLLNEDFFLYYEETDWCFRARERGHASIYVPGAKVWHKISQSFGGERSPLAIYFITRNRLLWARRHARLFRRLKLNLVTTRSLISRFLVPIFSVRRNGNLSIKTWWWAVRSAYQDPKNLAFAFGVRDYLLRHFGDCPDTIRKIAKQLTPTSNKKRT